MKEDPIQQSSIGIHGCLKGRDGLCHLGVAKQAFRGQDKAPLKVPSRFGSHSLKVVGSEGAWFHHNGINGVTAVVLKVSLKVVGSRLF